VAANPHPPKTTTDFGASLGSAFQAAGATATTASQQIQGPWKGLAWVLGQSGPAYVNRGNLAIRGIRKYGG
jgi:hypothetical protein